MWLETIRVRSHLIETIKTVNGKYSINSESFLNTTKVEEEDTQRNYYLKRGPDWTLKNFIQQYSGRQVALFDWHMCYSKCSIECDECTECSDECDRCNNDELTCIQSKVKLARELSLPAAEADSVTMTSHVAAASRLRQLSRSFHLHLSSSASSSSSSIDILRMVSLFVSLSVRLSVCLSAA